MSDPSPDGPRAGGWVPPPADATRDITLPPMADRPGPAVRPEWASYVSAPPQAPPPPQVPPAPPRQQPEPLAPEPGPQLAPRPAAREESLPIAGQPRRQHDPPTDRLAARPDPARSRTLTFDSPPQVQLLKVSVGPSRRSGWVWALVILIPLAIIIGSGVWLLALFYGG